MSLRTPLNSIENVMMDDDGYAFSPASRNGGILSHRHDKWASGDASSPPNPAIASTHDRRSPDGMANNRSVAASPKNRVDHVQDEISSWFLQLIDDRKLNAAAICAPFCALGMIAVACLLQVSLLHPLQSAIDVLGVLFSIRLWMCAILVIAVTFVDAFLQLRFLFKAEGRTRPDISLPQTWAIVAVHAALNGMAVLALLLGANVSLQWLTRTSVVYTITGVGLASAISILSSDCQLHFVGTDVGQLTTGQLVSWLFDSVVHILAPTTGFELIRTYRVTLPASIVVCTFTSGLASTFLTLLSPTLHFSTVLYVWMVLFFQLVVLRFGRTFVMQPLEFSFPPVFYSPSSTDAPEQRHLLHAVSAEIPLLRMFAFHDMARLSRDDVARRAQVFSLSQPGGYARNWDGLLAACLGVFNSIVLSIDSETEVNVPAVTSAVPYEEFSTADRAMNLAPRRVRQTLYGETTPMVVRRRRAEHLKRRQTVSQAMPLTIFQKRIRDLWTRWTGREQLLLDPSLVTIVQYALDSVAALAVASWTEDKFGVVQRRLTELLRSIIRLSTAADAFIRTQGGHVSSGSIQQVQTVRYAATAALLRIHSRFDRTLKSLDLTQQELEQLQLAISI